ncbi:MAG: hypothetical protein IPJ19_12535 [Planctomycetes bacterium]|nr:hypothetical protein [Planctomycetota bacterium]
MVSFDDGLGGGPALWVIGCGAAGGNVTTNHVARWHGGCVHTIDPMCFGDGTFATCPCSNYGASQHGCRNSASAAGALLGYSGASQPDTLVLASSSEPATSTTIFLQSDLLYPYGQFNFGDGIRCLGGQLRRLYLKSATSGTAQAPEPGDLSITQRSAALGDPLLPGAVRYYQAWYRDSTAYCTGLTFNMSNGLRVVW